MTTKNDLNLRVNEWKQGKIKTLFITGYLGSGKTVTGKELAKKYNAEFIELDSYREKEINRLIKKDISKITTEQVDKLWDTILKDLECRIELNKKRLIIEGIEIVFMTRKVVLSQAVLIKNTGLFKSTYRACKRNIQNKFENGYENESIFYIIKDTIKNQKLFHKHIVSFWHAPLE